MKRLSCGVTKLNLGLKTHFDLDHLMFNIFKNTGTKLERTFFHNQEEILEKNDQKISSQANFIKKTKTRISKRIHSLQSRNRLISNQNIKHEKNLLTPFKSCWTGL